MALLTNLTVLWVSETQLLYSSIEYWCSFTDLICMLFLAYGSSLISKFADLFINSHLYWCVLQENRFACMRLFCLLKWWRLMHAYQHIHGGKVQSYLEKHSKEECKDNIRKERWPRFLHGLAIKIRYFLSAGLQNKQHESLLYFKEKDPLVALQY